MIEISRINEFIQVKSIIASQRLVDPAVKGSPCRHNRALTLVITPQQVTALVDRDKRNAVDTAKAPGGHFGAVASDTPVQAKTARPVGAA